MAAALLGFGWLLGYSSGDSPGKAKWKLGVSSRIRKYWPSRYSIFSKYDDGILLDDEGFYSATPEALANHHARRCFGKVVIDAFSGCGGNSIAFARAGAKVIAIDTNPSRLEMLKHNSRIYGVREGEIETLEGDFLTLSKEGRVQGDVVFLSPPWGGPEYKKSTAFDLGRLPVIHISLFQLLNLARLCLRDPTQGRVACFLPKNTNISQLKSLIPHGEQWELECNRLNGFVKGYTLLLNGCTLLLNGTAT
ncbi:hypothetical protein AAMO2058_000356300 [Amorphochlora amoebiformis]